LPHRAGHGHGRLLSDRNAINGVVTMISRSIRHDRLAAMLAAALIALPFQLLAEQVFSDPVGDLIGLDSDGPDVTALIATDLGNALRLEIELANPNEAIDLAGLIEIDAEMEIDSEAHSGRRSRLSLLCPKPTGLGVNRTINLLALQSTGVPVLDASDEVLGRARGQPTVRGYTLTIDKSLIGQEIGTIGLAMVIGQEEASDCIPDGGELTRALVSLHRVLISVSAETGGMVSGSGAAEFESEVTVNAMPDPDHEFAGWFENDILVSTHPDFTFTATTSRSLTAQFNSTYTIGGTVSGLEDGEEVTVQLNQDELLTITENEAFQFETGLTAGTSYEVTVADQPAGELRFCRVENGSGQIDSDTVDNVQVICESGHESLFEDRFEVTD
jgi:hypothetical protein